MTLTNVADLHNARDESRQALKVYGEALGLWEVIGDSFGKGRVFSGMAAAHADLSETPQALDLFAKALEQHRTAKDRRGEARTLFLIGKTYESAGDQSRALEHYQKAMDVEEQVWATAGLDEVKVRLSEQSAELFRRTVLLQFKVGRKEEAFNTSETARSRTFLDSDGQCTIRFS